MKASIIPALIFTMVVMFVVGYLFDSDHNPNLMITASLLWAIALISLEVSELRKQSDEKLHTLNLMADLLKTMSETFKEPPQ